MVHKYVYNDLEGAHNLRKANDMLSEYSKQLQRLIDFVQGSKNVQRVQVIKATDLMKELKESLTKLADSQPKFKKNLNNESLYQAMLQPYQNRLQEIRGEIDELCKNQ